MSKLKQNVLCEDGIVDLLPHFLGSPAALALFDCLTTELQWEEEWIMLGARRVKVPRQVCWYGDPGAAYRYSGVLHHPRPWTTALREVRAAVEEAAGTCFNSVLGNYYRNGQDSMGWHADREPELGTDPFIASLSLGACRLFKLRHQRSGDTVDVTLDNGSLLLMHGSLQHHWRHCLPKTQRKVSPRINLTFRLITRLTTSSPSATDPSYP